MLGTEIVFTPVKSCLNRVYFSARVLRWKDCCLPEGRPTPTRVHRDGLLPGTLRSEGNPPVTESKRPPRLLGPPRSHPKTSWESYPLRVRCGSTGLRECRVFLAHSLRGRTPCFESWRDLCWFTGHSRSLKLVWQSPRVTTLRFTPSLTDRHPPLSTRNPLSRPLARGVLVKPFVPRSTTHLVRHLYRGCPEPRPDRRRRSKKGPQTTRGPS